MPEADPIDSLAQAIRDEWSVMVSLVRWRMRAARQDAEDWLQDAIVNVLRHPPARPVRHWRAYLVACAVHEGYRGAALRRERREVACDEVVHGVALNRVKLRRAA